ncbi:MAG: hypothetical protein IT462_16805 [Planctomycetes bacterium]|nr:hypothetical protein [Planctomycetota bacterium]
MGEEQVSSTAPAESAVAQSGPAEQPKAESKTSIRARIEKSRIPTGGLLGAIMWPFRMLKVLYAWLLSLADTKWGPTAMFLTGVGDGSFFPIPADPLLLACCFAKREKSIHYANLLVLASVFGGLSGWLVGYLWFDSMALWVINTFGMHDQWFSTAMHPDVQKLTADQVAALPQLAGETFYPGGYLYECKKELENNALLFYITGALTPIPYNVTVMAGGLFNVSIPALVVGTIIGRGIRFWAIGILAYYFGKRVKPFIERYFEWIAMGILVVVVLMVVGYRLLAKG